MKENCVGWKSDCEQIFIQYFQTHPTKFSRGIGLLFVSSNISFLDVIWNVRTSNFERFNKTKTLCQIITIEKNIHTKSKWAWTATKKILTIYLNYKNKMEKNTNMEQKKLKIVEKEKASRPKKVYRINRKKRKVEEAYPITRFTSAWLFIIRVYKLWQKHVCCHLWFNIEWKNE